MTWESMVYRSQIGKQWETDVNYYQSYVLPIRYSQAQIHRDSCNLVDDLIVDEQVHHNWKIKCSELKRVLETTAQLSEIIYYYDMSDIILICSKKELKLQKSVAIIIIWIGSVNKKSNKIIEKKMRK